MNLLILLFFNMKNIILDNKYKTSSILLNLFTDKIDILWV